MTTPQMMSPRYSLPPLEAVRADRAAGAGASVAAGAAGAAASVVAGAAAAAETGVVLSAFATSPTVAFDCATTHTTEATAPAIQVKILLFTFNVSGGGGGIRTPEGV